LHCGLLKLLRQFIREGSNKFVPTGSFLNSEYPALYSIDVESASW
jgi:hypothetical protein